VRLALVELVVVVRGHLYLQLTAQMEAQIQEAVLVVETILLAVELEALALSSFATQAHLLMQQA
jgi:hypothetical protein